MTKTETPAAPAAPKLKPGRAVDFFLGATKCIGLVTAVHAEDGGPQRITCAVFGVDGHSRGGNDARYDLDHPHDANTWCFEHPHEKLER